MGVELPGIGIKYEIELPSGKVAVIITELGKIQIYILEKGASKPSTVELTSKEALRLGSILTGSIFKGEDEGVEVIFTTLADLSIVVHSYIVTKKIVGKTIGDLKIRSKTGATVLAISKKGRNIVNPDPSIKLEEDDIIVVIGEHEQIKNFEKEILGRE